MNEVQKHTNAALDVISEHIRDLDLFLAIDKTQAVVLMKWHGQLTPLIILEEDAIQLGSSLSYLTRRHAGKQGNDVRTVTTRCVCKGALRYVPPI